MNGLTKVLDSRTQFGFDIFGESFEDFLPLPPAGSAYYVQTQDPSINYVNQIGSFYVRT